MRRHAIDKLYSTDPCRPSPPTPLTASSQNQVVQIDGLLTPAQCDAMVRLVQQAIHNPPPQGPEAAEQAREPWVVAHSPDAWTTKCGTACSQESVVRELDSAVEALTTRPGRNLERYQLLHYEVRQGYGLHHDFIASHRELPQGTQPHPHCSALFTPTPTAL